MRQLAIMRFYVCDFDHSEFRYRSLILTDKARGLHYASGQKQTRRVVDAGDDGPMDRDAGVGVSAGDAADGATCVLPQHGTGLQPVRDESE